MAPSLTNKTVAQDEGVGSIVGDDDHRLGLQVAGGKGLDAVRPGAGPLGDVGRGYSVTPEFRPHGFDPAIENARAPLGVASDLRPRVDVDQRHRLRRGAGGGVDNLLPADDGQGRAPPRRGVEIVALDDRGRRAACRDESDPADERGAPQPCHAATVFSAEKP